MGERSEAPPNIVPMYRLGANTPPDPPDPKVAQFARSSATNSASSTSQANLTHNADSTAGNPAP